MACLLLVFTLKNDFMASHALTFRRRTQAMHFLLKSVCKMIDNPRHHKIMSVGPKSILSAHSPCR